MKKFLIKNKKKILIILSIILIFSISTVSLVFAFNGEKPKPVVKEEIINYRLSLLGEEYNEILLNQEFVDLGVELYKDEVLIDDQVEVENKLDITKPGEYKIIYSFNNVSIYRIIKVIDNIPPVITLKGSVKFIVLQDEKYIEPGYTAIDNIDGDITDKVEVIGTVDTTKVGEYTITYKTTDLSGNETISTRKVTVKKKLVQKQEPVEVKEEIKKIVNKNEITDMSFTTSSVNGVINYDNTLKAIYLLDINSNERHEITFNSLANNYSFNIDISILNNGIYDLYIENVESELVKNNLDNLYRISRARIGNKLVTLNYENNNVRIIIENFGYQYDILIDVGHGGADSGAINYYLYEKDLNLEISLYEKLRYEQHGLKVLMTRSTDSLSLLKGDSSWKELTRRSYAMGYYGVVSKYTYSNHHNSSTNSNSMGYEILVPAKASATDLKVEYSVMSNWNSIYTLTETHPRFYTRDYDTEAIKSKVNGEVYSFNNYYAVLRIPYNLFNVKTAIYEHSFMSNYNDFNWYYLEGNWKKVCEAKIKAYVEALGVVYIPVE